MACSVQIILNYVKTCIEVCITLIITLLTSKSALVSSVVFCNMSTLGTFLRSVAGINIVNFNASKLGLVLDKLFQLKIRPRTMFSAILSVFHSFASLLIDNLVYIRQFFKYNCGSFFKRINNLFGNAMIYIFAKAVLLASYFGKVSFPRVPFLLKSRPQSLITSRNLFNMSSTKKLLIRGNGQFFDSSINANEFFIGRVQFSRFIKGYMQPNDVMPNKQLSRSSSPGQVFFEIFRHNKRSFNPFVDGLKRNKILFERDGKGFIVIPDAGLFRLRAREGFGFSFLPRSPLVFFGLESFDRFKRFNSFSSGRTRQVSSQVFPTTPIRFVMQGDPIPIIVFPSCVAHKIVGSGVRLNSRQNFLGRDLESKSDCSNHIIHIGIIQSFECNSEKMFEKQQIQQKGEDSHSFAFL